MTNILLFTSFLLMFVSLASSFRSISLKFNKNRLQKLKLIENDDLDSLKVDITKLSDKERQRIELINKVTKEADDFALAAGFDVNNSKNERLKSLNDDNSVTKSVQETKWSGQSDVEETFKSSNTWKDLFDRKLLAFGDVSALLLFVIIGRQSHAEGIDILNVLTTAAPFVFSWLVVSPLVGSYSRDATSSSNSIPIKTLKGWAVSMPFALAIRGLLKGAIPPTPFIIVSLIATYIVLVAWRYLYVVAFGETSDDEYKKAGFFEVFKMIGSLIRRW